MEDSAEESISVVTISVPSTTTAASSSLSSPSALLVRSSSLVQLVQNHSSPPLTLTLLQSEDDADAGNKRNQRVNVITNKCFTESEQQSSSDPHDLTLHYSPAESLNLTDLSTLPNAQQYNTISASNLPNSALITTRNHIGAVNSTAKSASLNNNNNNNSFVSGKKENADKEEEEKRKISFWKRIQSTICCNRIKGETAASSSAITTTITTTNNSHKRKPRLGRLLYYLRVFLTHLFSTTGLCFLVVAYSGLGAVIFTHLESGHEFAVKASLEDERRRTALELWNYTETLNVLHREQWLEEVVLRIGAFEEKVVKTMLTEGYGATVEQWSFSGALLYSVTVITTIGYGNVTCKTDWGRIATILYAIVGIPITFLCLANLGNLMAKAFRFSYRKICCCECFCPSKTAKLRKRLSRRSSASRSASRHSRHRQRQKVVAANAVVEGKTESGGEPSPQTISTGTPAFLLPQPIPLPPPQPPMTPPPITPPAYNFDNVFNGDQQQQQHSIVLFNAPDAGGKRLNASVDLQRSHSLHTRSSSVNYQQGPPSPALTVVTVRSAASNDGGTPRTELLRPKTGKVAAAEELYHFTDVNNGDGGITTAENDDDDDDESSLSDIDLDQEELDALEDEERVPISLVFLLVLGYIVLGAFMFSIWEQWGPIEGAYFCFTTLTTIGFGDLVPGSAKLSQDKDGQTKFIMCCVYMMCGLALIAMSFNLVQEEIVIKCRRIARRLGIMPSKKEHKRFSAENRRRFKAIWSKAEQEKMDVI